MERSKSRPITTNPKHSRKLTPNLQHSKAMCKHTTYKHQTLNTYNQMKLNRLSTITTILPCRKSHRQRGLMRPMIIKIGRVVTSKEPLPFPTHQGVTNRQANNNREVYTTDKTELQRCRISRTQVEDSMLKSIDNFFKFNNILVLQELRIFNILLYLFLDW